MMRRRGWANNGIDADKPRLSGNESCVTVEPRFAGHATHVMPDGQPQGRAATDRKAEDLRCSAPSLAPGAHASRAVRVAAVRGRRRCDKQAYHTARQVHLIGTAA